MGETRVDLLHLLEDLRDAYPGALEETILTEIVANALDSGATQVRLATFAADATLMVVDNGTGMSRRELARYHDLASTTKQRGRGVGFAGVGIKLGLLASDEVVTETRARRTKPVATSWHLKSKHRAPWKWVEPQGIVGERGTGIRLRLPNPLSPLLDEGYLETALRRHFQSLFDAAFDEILAPFYPAGIQFSMNGRVLERGAPSSERAPVNIRLPRKRRPAAVGYLSRCPAPLPDDERGVAISTLGKIIKRGWDWLGIMPAGADRITGLIEVPALAECLTLNKADFIRTGPRGAIYLAYRKAIQEAVTAQLAIWGDGQPAPEANRPRTRPRARPSGRAARSGSRFSAAGSAGRPSSWWTAPATAGPVRSGRGSGSYALCAIGTAGLSAEIEPASPEPAATAPVADTAPDQLNEDAQRGPPPRVSEPLPDPAGRKRPTRLGLSYPVRSPPCQPRAGEAGRLGGVGERCASGVPPRRGLTLGGLSPRGGRGHGTGTAGGRCGRSARICHGVFGAVGRGGEGAE